MNIDLKSTLTTLFAASIVLANVTAAKLAAIPLPGLGEVVVPAGFIAFGVAFVCSDLLVEFYGPRRRRPRDARGASRVVGAYGDDEPAVLAAP